MRYVQVIEYVHEGGTKDYIYVMMVEDNGSCVLLRRNGKRGEVGQMQRGSVGSLDHIRSEMKKDHSKRTKNGYTLKESSTCNNLGEAEIVLRGQKWGRPEGRIATDIMNFMQGQTGEPEVDAVKEHEVATADLDRGDDWGSW